MPESHFEESYLELERDLSRLYRIVPIDPDFVTRCENKIHFRVAEIAVRRKPADPSPGKPRTSWMVSTVRIIGWGLAAALFLLVLAWGSGRLNPPVPPAAVVSPTNLPATRTAPASLPITSTVPPTSGSAWGKVAFVQAGALWVKELPDGQPQRLDQAGQGISHPVWSPSGKWLAYQDNTGRAWLIEVSSGDTSLLDDTPYNGYAWSPQDDRIASIHNGDELRLSTPGNQDTTGLASVESPVQIELLAWSPDGQWIAYVVQANQGDQQISLGLWKISAAGGEPVELYTSTDFELFSGVDHLAGWTSDGDNLIFWQGNPFFSASLAADGLPLAEISSTGGQPTQIVDQVLVNSDFVKPDPSGTSRLAVIEGSSRETWTNKILIRVERGKSAALTAPDMAVDSLAWSPDGAQLVFSAGPDLGSLAAVNDPTTLQRHLWLTGLEPGELQQLTSAPGYTDEHPAWLPDNQGLLFVRRSADGQASLWRLADLGQGAQLTPVVDQIDPGPEIYGHVDWTQIFDWWQPNLG